MLATVPIEKAYEIAGEKYAEVGVNTEKAMAALSNISISLHCWQGDDVGGFEAPDAALSGGGIQVTGNHPGKARTIAELRQDLQKAFSLIPGNHRLNLHAMYGEFGGRFVDRNEIGTEHYKGWVEWAKDQEIKLDFNATCFSHPKADSGLTLSSLDKEIRRFWIEHVKLCREISAFMGRKLQSPCIHNLWIPDGYKDIPVDRWKPRALLKDSLDEIYAVEHSSSEAKDAVESKLFGIGSEAYVVGSHEFYMAYALKNGIMPCFDLGHYHPTESVADKISAVMQFCEELLLHVSRPVRWDSDHVVILNDDIRAVTEEIVRSNCLDRIHIALDFFDASMNRVGAWTIGTRATLKGLLIALLEPAEKLREYEHSGNNFARLAMLEEMKIMPFGAVWDYYCLKAEVPTGEIWLEEIEAYENNVTRKRG
jgi:L-rhamnose isomerase